LEDFVEEAGALRIANLMYESEHKILITHLKRYLNTLQKIQKAQEEGKPIAIIWDGGEFTNYTFLHTYYEHRGVTDQDWVTDEQFKTLYDLYLLTIELRQTLLLSYPHLVYSLELSLSPEDETDYYMQVSYVQTSYFNPKSYEVKPVLMDVTLAKEPRYVAPTPKTFKMCLVFQENMARRHEQTRVTLGNLAAPNADNWTLGDLAQSVVMYKVWSEQMAWALVIPSQGYYVGYVYQALGLDDHSATCTSKCKSGAVDLKHHRQMSGCDAELCTPECPAYLTYDRLSKTLDVGLNQKSWEHGYRQCIYLHAKLFQALVNWHTKTDVCG
jgi:hypothetical protein